VTIEEEDTGELIGDSLAEIITTIGRWEQYLQKYPTSARIRRAITTLYASVVSFLVRAHAFYKKPKVSKYMDIRMLQLGSTSSKD